MRALFCCFQAGRFEPQQFDLVVQVGDGARVMGLFRGAQIGWTWR